MTEGETEVSLPEGIKPLAKPRQVNILQRPGNFVAGLEMSDSTLVTRRQQVELLRAEVEGLLGKPIVIGKGVLPSGVTGPDKRPIGRMILNDENDIVLTEAVLRALKEGRSFFPFIKAFQIVRAVHRMFEYNANYVSRVEFQLARERKEKRLPDSVPIGEIIAATGEVKDIGAIGTEHEGFFTFIRTEPEKPYVGICRHMAAICSSALKAAFGNAGYCILEDDGVPHGIATVKIKLLRLYADPARNVIYLPPFFKNAYGVEKPELTVDLE